MAGEHNVYNALAAIAVSLENGISMDAIRVGLAHFTGTNRRFEKKGEVNGFTIIDDYAHHPHEIEATLKDGAELSTQDTLVHFPAAHLHADEGISAAVCRGALTGR